MWPFTPRYQRVLETDSGIIGSTDSKHVFSTEKKISSTRYLLVLGVIATTIALGFVIHSIRHTSLSHNFSYPKQHCGNTTAEAKENGCEFDLLDYSWMPADCFDRETAAEFRQWVYDQDRERGAWPFFVDGQMKQKVADEEALSERSAVWTWTTEEEHIGHCVFLARRLHRAAEGKYRLPPHVENINHTIHCTNEVLDNLLHSPPLHEVKSGISTFKVTFQTC